MAEPTICHCSIVGISMELVGLSIWLHYNEYEYLCVWACALNGYIIKCIPHYFVWNVIAYDLYVSEWKLIAHEIFVWCNVDFVLGNWLRCHWIDKQFPWLRTYVSNAYIRWTMERKLCIDFGNVRNVQQICHYAAIFKVVDNSWQFTDTHNSNQQLNGRALTIARWSLVNHNTIQFWYKVIWFDVDGQGCVGDCRRCAYAAATICICVYAVRCFFLLKSNYLTRSKCGDSNYQYTWNNSNQWTRTTAQNHSLAFKLEKRNYVACKIVVQGLHSLFSLSIYKHPLCHHMCLWQSVCRFSISMLCVCVCVSLYARCTIHTHQMTTTPLQ